MKLIAAIDTYSPNAMIKYILRLQNAHGAAMNIFTCKKLFHIAHLAKPIQFIYVCVICWPKK